MVLKRPSHWNETENVNWMICLSILYYFGFWFVLLNVSFSPTQCSLFSVSFILFFFFVIFVPFLSFAIVVECVLVFSIVSFVIRILHNFVLFLWMHSHSIFDFTSSNRNKKLLKMKLCDIRNTCALSVVSWVSEKFMFQRNNKMKASTISLFGSRTSTYSSYN